MPVGPTHVEPVHASPAAHMRPHMPQCAGVDERSTSQPLPGIPSQFAKPGAHETSSHVPVSHDSIAFARLHGVPQPPQSVNVRAKTSQPSVVSMLQSAWPGLHAPNAQAPVAHVPLAFVNSHGV